MAKAILFQDGKEGDILATPGVDFSTSYEPETGNYTIRTEMSSNGKPINGIVLTPDEARTLCLTLMARYNVVANDGTASDKASLFPHIDIEAQVAYESGKWETVERGDDVDDLKRAAFDALTDVPADQEERPVGVRVVEIHTHAQYNVRRA